MKQIVCLAADPWSRYPKRTQQLLTRLRDAEILYFNPPVSTLSRFGGARGKQYAAAYQQRERQVRTHIFVGALPPMRPFFEKSAAIERANARRMARHIAQRTRAHGFQSPAIWVASPLYAAVAEELPSPCVIYDCAGFFEYPDRMERALATRADVVFSSAPAFSERMLAFNSNVALIPDGSDYLLYTRAGEHADAFPAGLFNVKSPILGFAGVLPPGTDFSPVLHAATLRPDWNFVFAGRISETPGEVRALPNVRFFSCRSPAQTAEYAARFDLCFHLRVPGDPVPERFYASLLNAFATGRPTVMMLGPDEAPPFPELAETARTPAEFAAACRKALHGNSDWLSSRKRQFSASCAWSRRAEEVGRILDANGVI